MTPEAVSQYLDEIEHQLLNQSAEISVGLNNIWANQFLNKPAVYIFKEDKTIIHAGETKDLKAEMMELVSSKNFEGDMNGLLSAVVSKHLKLSYLFVDLGRKELQERILQKIGTNQKAYTKAEKQQEHTNAYEPWTPEADEKLELLFCEGKTVKELTEIFGRNDGAIRSRIKKLELKEKYNR